MVKKGEKLGPNGFAAKEFDLNYLYKFVLLGREIFLLSIANIATMASLICCGVYSN